MKSAKRAFVFSRHSSQHAGWSAKNLYKLTLCSPLLVLAAIFAPIVAFEDQASQSTPAIGQLGNEKCLSCHEEQKSYLRTAHHLTSRPATRESIAGKFEDGKNILKTSELELHYRMEAKKDGFFQTAVLGSAPGTATTSKRFDLVVGSGRKGQTYFYWDDKDQLFQLPASFWIELDTWVHSPGFDDRVVNFSRRVLPRCLECHATSFEVLKDSGVLNRYNRSDYVLGISCEKCHGPGQEHVNLQNAKTSKPTQQAILNLAKLPRERQIDLCALCHGGLGVAKAPAFAYSAGKDLKDYLQLEIPAPNEAVDVHGNQVALLRRSRCYQDSNMTCSTCHDVHLPQRETAALSGRCMECHQTESCGLFPRLGQKIVGKCVDCHMPLQTSNLIVSSHEGKRLRPQVRTHWIKVYPEITIR